MAHVLKDEMIHSGQESRASREEVGGDVQSEDNVWVKEGKIISESEVEGKRRHAMRTCAETIVTWTAWPRKTAARCSPFFSISETPEVFGAVFKFFNSPLLFRDDHQHVFQPYLEFPIKIH